MADVQWYDESATEWKTIEQAMWRVENGVSSKMPAPRAVIETNANVDLLPNTDIRVREGSEPIFVGYTRNGGEYGDRGQQRINCRSEAYKILNEEVSVSVTSGTDYDVLSDAVAATSRSADFSLFYPETPINIGDYDATERKLKVILRDMADRTGRIWYFTSDANALTIQSLGYRGTWETLETGSDNIAIEKWNGGEIDAVQNSITVTGTGSDPVTSDTIEDTNSIDKYGRQSASYSYRWIQTKTQANDLANQLLIPEPLESGKVTIPETSASGNTWNNLSNYTIDLTDSTRGINSVLATIEKQVIQEGRTTLHVGKGVSYAESSINRNSQSSQDAIRTDYSQLDGEVVNSDLANDSVDRQQIVNRAVDNQRIELSTIIAENMGSSSVERNAIADAAVNGSKVETGSIGASRLFIEDWIPVGLSLSSNDPNTGDISWNSHTLVYEGNEYSISSGSTSNRYVYWNYTDGFYSTSNSKPSLGDDDALVAINDNGEANEVLQATEIHGATIRTGTLSAAEVETATITGTEFDRIVDGEVVDSGNIINLVADKVTFSQTGDSIDGLTTTEDSATVIEGAKIKTGSITANEIDAGTITANEIKSLVLNSNTLFIDPSVGTGSIEFGLDSNLNFVSMKPNSNGVGRIGTAQRFWDNGYFQDLNVSDTLFGTTIADVNLMDLAQPLEFDEGAVSTFYIGENPMSGKSGIALWPSSSSRAEVGTGDGTTDDKAIGSVHTINLYQYSPEPLSPDDPRIETPTDGGPPIDLDELQNSTWYDPPEYAAQGKDVETGEYQKNPKREDGTRGVELGHMTNYIFEVSKRLARERDELQKQVDSLESRLSKLESQVGE